MASLHKKSDGSSQFWYAAYRNASGQRTTRSTKTTDSRLAKRMALEWEKAAMDGSAGRFVEAQARRVLSEIAEQATGSPLHFHSCRVWFDEWLAGKSTAKAERTIVKYRQVCEAFLTHLGPRADLPLAVISLADVRGFRDVLFKEGRAPSTVNGNIRKVLSMPFAAAQRLGYITVNPCAGVDALNDEKEAEKAAFTREQVAALLSTAKGDWQGAILAGLSTGRRLGDVARLQWGAVDLQWLAVEHLNREWADNVEGFLLPYQLYLPEPHPFHEPTLVALEMPPMGELEWPAVHAVVELTLRLNAWLARVPQAVREEAAGRLRLWPVTARQKGRGHEIAPILVACLPDEKADVVEGGAGWRKVEPVLTSLARKLEASGLALWPRLRRGPGNEWASAANEWARQVRSAVYHIRAAPETDMPLAFPPAEFEERLQAAKAALAKATETGRSTNPLSAFQALEKQARASVESWRSADGEGGKTLKQWALALPPLSPETAREWGRFAFAYTEAVCAGKPIDRCADFAEFADRREGKVESKKSAKQAAGGKVAIAKRASRRDGVRKALCEAFESMAIVPG